MQNFRPQNYWIKTGILRSWGDVYAHGRCTSFKSFTNHCSWLMVFSLSCLLLFSRHQHPLHYLSMKSSQLISLEQQKLIISQFLCLRNLGNTYLDPLAQGLSQGCNQGASWGCSQLRPGWGVATLSSLMWLLTGLRSSQAVVLRASGSHWLMARDLSQFLAWLVSPPGTSKYGSWLHRANNWKSKMEARFLL